MTFPTQSTELTPIELMRWIGQGSLKRIDKAYDDFLHCLKNAGGMSAIYFNKLLEGIPRNCKVIIKADMKIKYDTVA